MLFRLGFVIIGAMLRGSFIFLVFGVRLFTFMLETDGKYRLVGRCLMVVILDFTVTFSTVRDGLEAGIILFGLFVT